ncbi:MAG: hypothetical protein Ct9H300mP9_2550 [Candidatus Neomarinimicrobiota bacterium]|nr:MAG: hypothetical protein Ct9H300mP9_2550 [Candidatus Neomarinimicrobiota bacterium]
MGSFAAKFLDEYGCKIVGVSDVTGGIHEPDGLEIPSLFDQTLITEPLMVVAKVKK